MMQEKYIILGAGGHAKTVIDILEQNNKKIAGLTDYTDNHNCMGYPILGNDEILPALYQEGIQNAVLGIGNMGNSAIRLKVYEKARKIGYIFPNVIHPSAIIADSVKMGEGIVCSAGCIVNASVKIGSLSILNTACVVEHETVIGEGVHLAPHSTVSGNVRIGNWSFCGAGSVVIQGVTIGKNCIVGAGAVVLHDLPDNAVAVGVPAHIIRYKES